MLKALLPCVQFFSFSYIIMQVGEMLITVQKNKKSVLFDMTLCVVLSNTCIICGTFRHCKDRVVLGHGLNSIIAIHCTIISCVHLFWCSVCISSLIRGQLFRSWEEMFKATLHMSMGWRATMSSRLLTLGNKGGGLRGPKSGLRY